MLYMFFSSIRPNQWEAVTPVKSTKPVATITRRRGKCSASITAGRALNSEELSGLSAFMQEHSRA